MVEPRFKKWSSFTVFVLPCLVLYLLFFIAPFFNGVSISFTNWDGLASKIPMQIEKSQYEKEVLPRLSEKEQVYLSGVYELNKYENRYKRGAIHGLRKYKTGHLLKKAGYESENYRFVGFDNYKKIFTGKTSKSFYPHRETIQKYTKTSSLPFFISREEFEKEIIDDDITSSEKALLKDAYRYQVGVKKYKLENEYNDVEITKPLKTLEVKSKLLNKLTRELKEKQTLEEMKSSLLAFKNENNLESFPISDDKQDLMCEKLLAVSQVKNALEKTWVVKLFNMGVTGFTLFFAFFSVIGINVLAFALALALDTGIKGQKVLRTIYFLPNVLSMIIVALIWNMLFNQLLPALTGIERWISDPKKTPWLLVLVAIWQGSGYYMIIYLAGLQNIPEDIIEAAVMDGASWWKRFRFITLPMMIPSLTISLFLTIANAFKSFDLMYALVGPSGYSTGTVPIVYDIYFQAYANKEAGMATAKAMLLFLVIVLITGIQLFTMKRKEIEA